MTTQVRSLTSQAASPTVSLLAGVKFNFICACVCLLWFSLFVFVEHNLLHSETDHKRVGCK